MKYMKGSEIRNRWISFFESKGHRYIPGVNLIPQGDKSLLWVNAGVTGLKKYFDGSEVPPCRRIVNVQKSIRTNDIENVGHTARHHTFFEMLGNFSIGDYFRNEVIPWAYEILTNEKTGFGIPKEKLYITYEPHDTATHDLWVRCGMDPEHLIPLKDNFWEIGEGPCGPDTEMFFDRGEKYDPKHLGVKMLQDDIENDRYIEIWNIVFSQYNSEAGVARENYKELPSKNIDTGSGLERLACILQGTETNFETDLFMPIIKAAEEICHKPYEGDNKMAYRVIADHARCLTFALSDGAYFSNEGRGYVLRRIIRRAMRYGQKLGINEPFMYRLIRVCADEYKDFYPNLEEKVELVSKMVLDEEKKFIKTLSTGEEILRQKMEGKQTLEGSVIFLLYDTYGFPADMTKEICEENGVKADMDGFQKCMEEQKERARAARGDIESFHKQSKDLLEFKTPSEFVYDQESLKAKVTGLFVDGNAVEEIEEEGDVAFDLTPFYAEMGGQVSDTGTLKNDSVLGTITRVGKAPAGQHLHHVHLQFGHLSVGEEVELALDSKRRHLIERNHSATHLLHAAISEILGKHVEQKGSYCDENYLRFDFTSMDKLSSEDLNKIEALVNEKIAESIPEETKILPVEEAKNLGAEMEFSEKYGSVVRVVCFEDFSKEFCGGTHVKNTSEIGLFVLESESSVSAGTRRIQARTSLGAYQYLRRKSEVLASVESETLSKDDTVLESVKKLEGHIDELQTELNQLKDKMSSSEANELQKQFEEIDGIHFLAWKGEGERGDIMKLGDSLKSIHSDYVLFLCGKGSKGYSLVVFAGGKGAQIGAGKIMKEIAPILGGNGGGKPEMASGSAKNLDGFEAAISKAKTLL
ncbi:MAG: alanine--tRNA ligase [Candidatus Enteromonas sp.]|nr:alanine--tRNA ligase [Candidatus Enteromonas sp.]MDY5298058.1 alanine--tRNA ligase [Candidatus Enteromonas sp.]